MLVQVITTRYSIPDHESTEVLVAEVCVDQRCKLGRRHSEVGRSIRARLSEDTDGEQSVRALGSGGLETVEPLVEGETSKAQERRNLDTSLLVVRVLINPVANRASPGVVVLNPDDIELCAVNHQVHVRVGDNALRRTSDEVVAALREVGAKPVDHANVSGGGVYEI